MKPLASILERIGQTPLLHLSRIAPPGSAAIYAKLESLNPGGSLKDRVAKYLVEEAEARGKLRPGGTIVEATAGNLGVSLALVAAAKGYRAIVVMPEGANPLLRRLLLQLGAQVVLTPAAEGMGGAGRVAGELVARNPGYFGPKSFENPANPEAHRRTTAREILQALGNSIAALVAGIGTGGTITGVGEVLKKEVPGVLVIGVEPARSPLLTRGKAGPHGIPGLGASFIPPILNRNILDEVIPVGDEEAQEMTSSLARQEGLVVGPSSGACLAAALKIAERLGPGKRVVTIFADGGERYLALPLAETAEARHRRL